MSRGEIKRLVYYWNWKECPFLMPTTHLAEIGTKKTVPENCYHKPARKQSMSGSLPETGTQKFDTKLHFRRVRNQYQFSGTVSGASFP